jgi:CheY-like chemotaxis protein
MTDRIQILIVDDKDSHRRFVGDVLRSEGYQVIEAGSGEQAREILRQEGSLHLVVLDQMMPGLTGTTFWNQIKADKEFQHVWDLPVIFITAYPEDEAMRDLRAEGVLVLTKPLRDYHDILDAVDQVL